MEQNNNEKPTAESKALNLFSEMMIAKIESLSKKDGWKKPWFTEGALQWPQNLNGRDYNGMNAAMLLFLCEKNGYKIPRFCTFDCIQRMNQTAKKGEEEKPRVRVNKGEHSFPVMLTTFTVVDKETNEHIKWEDYKQLSQEQREKYNVYPKLQTYYVFNVNQTNLKEARPELWEKLEQEYSMPKVDKNNMFSFEPVDRMIADNRWICPIKPTYGDQAYYSISKNEIVVPEKGQFKDGESFYSNLYHEMSHSTGAENQLDRIKPTTFGSADYAREELVAELTAALTAQRYGMTKNLKTDSATYLKSWLDKLKESPQFIKTVLLDVKKASSMLTQRIDQIALEIEEEKKAKQMETIAVNADKDVKGLAADTASTGAERIPEQREEKKQEEKKEEKVATAAVSPIVKQYLDLKKKHPDAILLFRCGDFYETYKDDAVKASNILGITLTKSNGRKDDEGKPLAMAGFPYHALDTYLPKLIRAGERVAICDQLEMPKQTTSSKREITEMVTPGQETGKQMAQESQETGQHTSLRR